MQQSDVLLTGFCGSSSNSDAVYPYFLVPAEGVPVYPFRRGTSGGSSPVTTAFAACLERYVAPYGFEVFGNACLKFTDGGRCYNTGIVVAGNLPGVNLRIDIELDEPYDLHDFVPRHYLEDRSDSQRDNLMLQAGWVVVRFAEKQAATEPLNCAAFVIDLINSLVKAVSIEIPRGARLRPVPVRKWTRIAAEQLAGKGYREGYIGNAGSLFPDSERTYDNAPLSEEERTYAALLPERESFPAESRENDTGYNAEHRHVRDADIDFFPETHTYLYKRRDVLKSVTTVISEYFSAFDMYAAAERKAVRTGQNAQTLVDSWKYCGRKAAETGSFMHKQFENVFLGHKCEHAFDFSYSSSTFSRAERIDISKEMSMFSDFLRKSGLRPYRTEWNIYDAEKGIAGSPDLIAAYDGKLLMFDWKRSTKLVRASGNAYQIIDDCWGKYGFGALSTLRDNAFVHYSLQQGIYRYILEKHYGIRLHGMYLVIIHPDYERYYCIPVMDVSEQVRHIMDRL